MNREDFRVPEAGSLVEAPGSCYLAFVPAPAPPHLSYDADLVLALSRADARLGKAGDGDVSQLCQTAPVRLETLDLVQGLSRKMALPTIVAYDHRHIFDDQ